MSDLAEEQTRDARGRTPLMLACRSGDANEVDRLIASGADVNARNNSGTTPLMYAKTAAVGSGDTRVLCALIDAGADVNAKDAAGRTALDYLVERSEHIIAFLKSMGAE